MGGRSSAQMIAPLQPKPLRVEMGKAHDHVLDVWSDRGVNRGDATPVSPEKRRTAVTPLGAL
jgi:hypothetical protein